MEDTLKSSRSTECSNRKEKVLENKGSQYYDIIGVCFVFGNCNHCFCCGHPFTMLGVILFISCKNKIQCVCEIN